MSKILSIIIPSYNTSSYIDECLPYFLQNEILEFLEIIIISDGSTDNTVELANKYSNKYPLSIKVIDKENGGHGSVINRGIKEATGKYFKIVDGDDWVNPDGLVKLTNYLMQHDVDMVVDPYIEYDEKQKTKKIIKEEYFNNYENNKLFQFEDLIINSAIPMHEITYKTSILKSNDIHIDENTFYVDTEYVLYPLKYVKTIVFLPYLVYVYRINSDTQSTNINNAKKYVNNHYKVSISCLHYINDNVEYLTSQKRIYMESYVHKIISTQYHILLSFKPSSKYKQELIDWDNQVKQLNVKIYNMKSDLLITILKKSNFKLYALVVYLNLFRLFIKNK